MERAGIAAAVCLLVLSSGCTTADPSAQASPTAETATATTSETAASQALQSVAFDGTDADANGSYETFTITVGANTTLADADSGATDYGEPYFVVLVNETEVFRTEVLDRSESLNATFDITAEALRGAPAGNVTVTLELRDDDLVSDDTVATWRNRAVIETLPPAVTPSPTASVPASTSATTRPPTETPTSSPTPTHAPTSAPETTTSTPVTTTAPSSAGSVSIQAVHADAAGGNERDNLNDEYVVLVNAGETAVELTGWRLSDEKDHVYLFPSGFTLAPGATVTVHTGRGTDNQTDLYWGSDAPVWNNDGDTAFLEDASGGLVDEYPY